MIIDCHIHLLPHVDDGAKNADMALDMARRAVESGTDAVVATPHHLNGVFTNTRVDILSHIQELRSLLAQNDIALEIFPGAENHLAPELPDALTRGEAMTFADQQSAVLVELPKRTVPVGTDALLYRILGQGLTPVIAHPERNSELLSTPNRVADWVAMGCKTQLTGQSCSGSFGRNIQRTARRWLEQGLVHVVASDAHRPSGREPNLGPARETLARWLGEPNMALLTEENPARLIHGEPLRALGKPQVRRGLFSRLFD